MGCTCENNKVENDIEIKNMPKREIILDKKLLKNIITLQSHVRGVLYRKKFNLIDNILQIENKTNQNSYYNNYETNENKFSFFE